MVEIIVKRDFSEQDVKQASVAAAEFRPAHATSKADNVLNAADNCATVLLCSEHANKFATPSVLSKYGYRQMTRFPYAMGNCDYCKAYERCQVFSHLSVFNDVWKRQA